MYDITVTGYAGDFGSSLIYRDQRIGKELGSLYPKSFLKALDEPMDAMKVIQGDRELSELFDDHLREGLLIQASEGGIYKALWELLRAHRLGASFSQRAIPVRQQTIEVCEVLELDPYRLRSDGTWIWLTKESGRIVRLFERASLKGSAAVIGHTKKGPGIERDDGEAVAFLRRPEPDELTKVFLGDEEV